MTDEEESRFPIGRDHQDVVAVAGDRLVADGEPMALQVAVEVIENLFLLTGGAVYVDEASKELAEPPPVDPGAVVSHRLGACSV
jgi:hypothetical protein